MLNNLVKLVKNHRYKQIDKYQFYYLKKKNIRLMEFLPVETGQIMEFCQLDVEDLEVRR